MQGVVVSCDGDASECVIDDGTGVAVVDMKVFLKNTPPGMGKQPSKGECSRNEQCDKCCSMHLTH